MNDGYADGPMIAGQATLGAVNSARQGTLSGAKTTRTTELEMVEAQIKELFDRLVSIADRASLIETRTEQVADRVLLDRPNGAGLAGAGNNSRVDEPQPPRGSIEILRFAIRKCMDQADRIDTVQTHIFNEVERLERI